LLWLAPTHGRGFRAESLLITKPYTNALFARSFEEHVIQTIPGVTGLRVSPTFSKPPAPGFPAPTNGVAINIFVAGPTAGEAERMANEAAASLSVMVASNYDTSELVIEQPYKAHRYSFLNDTLIPAIARMFKH